MLHISLWIICYSVALHPCREI